MAHSQAFKLLLFLGLCALRQGSSQRDCTSCPDSVEEVCTTFGAKIQNRCLLECQPGLVEAPCPDAQAPSADPESDGAQAETVEVVVKSAKKASFVNCGKATTRQTMDQLRAEGYFFAGCGKTLTLEALGTPQESTGAEMATASNLKKVYETVVLLPKGQRFVRELPKVKLPEESLKPARRPAAAGRRSLVVMGKDDRKEVADSKVFPYSAVLYANYTMADKSWYTCSGSLVDRNLYVTAAHCVYDTETKAFLNNIQLYYGVNKGKYEGFVKATRVQVLTGYTPLGDMTYDFALITVDKPIGDTKGYLGVKYDCKQTNVPLRIAGFPNDKPRFSMWSTTCAVKYDKAGENCVADNWEHECDTFAGNSGSSMWDDQFNLRAVHVAGIDGWGNLATPIRREMWSMISTTAAANSIKGIKKKKRFSS